MKQIINEINECLSILGIKEESFNQYIKNIKNNKIQLKNSGNMAVGINLENSMSDFICYYCPDLYNNIGLSLVYKPSILKKIKYNIIPGYNFKLYKLSNKKFKYKLNDLLKCSENWVKTSENERYKLINFKNHKYSIRNKVLQEKCFILKKESDKKLKNNNYKIEYICEKLFGLQMEIIVSKYIQKNFDYYVYPYYQIGKSVDLIICTRNFNFRIYLDIKASKFYKLLSI